MRVGPGTIFADAGAIWRADRELLIALSGFFFVLPTFAMTLFMSPPAKVAEGELLGSEVLIAFFMANLHWIAISRIAEIFGVLTLFALCLDPARPTLGTAMRAAVAAFPIFLVLALLNGFLVFGGLTLFIVPGVYLVGRTFVAGTAMVAERRSDPFAALVRSFALTRGHGWMLFAVAALPWLAAQLVAMVVGPAAGPSVGPVILAATGFVTAIASGAATLTVSLAQVAAYRRLGESINGM